MCVRGVARDRKDSIFIEHATSSHHDPNRYGGYEFILKTREYTCYDGVFKRFWFAALGIEVSESKLIALPRPLLEDL